jgi:hypothetical protein
MTSRDSAGTATTRAGWPSVGRVVDVSGARSRRAAAALLLTVAATAAQARLPDAYAAIRVRPSPGVAERRFDLRPAIARARVSGKPMLWYFGAHDCPPCRVLENSFEEHSARLAPRLVARFQLIEIEGYLRGPRMVFVLPDGEYPLAALRVKLGDRGGGGFVWPSWFLLDANLRSLQPLPTGNAEYLDPDWVELRFGL